MNKTKYRRILFTEGPCDVDEQVPRPLQKMLRLASLAARRAPPDMDRLRLRLQSELRAELWKPGYQPSEPELDRLLVFVENLLMHLSTGGMFSCLTHEAVLALRQPSTAQ